MSDPRNLNAKGKKAICYTANKNYNRSLFKVFCISGCTRRFYHIDVRPKAFAKRDTDKSEVYSESETAQQKESREKIRIVDG